MAALIARGVSMVELEVVVMDEEAMTSSPGGISEPSTTPFGVVLDVCMDLEPMPAGALQSGEIALERS
jgi:hypothetical protein